VDDKLREIFERLLKARSKGAEFGLGDALMRVVHGPKMHKDIIQGKNYQH
jgi:hypothetical protein